MHSVTWARACKFQATDYPAIEHMEWSKTLEYMLPIDQLDAMNLVSAELIVSNLQRLEERYREKLVGTMDVPSCSSCFTSVVGGINGSLIDPKLSKFFGDQAAQEAREERQLLRKQKKNHKDKDDV